MDFKRRVKRGLAVFKQSKSRRDFLLCEKCSWAGDLYAEYKESHFVFPDNNKATLGRIAEVLRRKCEFCQMVGEAVSQRLRAANVLTPLEDYCWIVGYQRVPPRGGNLDVGAKEPRMGFDLHFGLPFWDSTRLEYDGVAQCIEVTLEQSKSGVTGTSLLNIDKLKGILTTCQSDHVGKCRGARPVPITDLPPGFRLVDVGRMCVIPAPVSCTYVALSYVWGSSPLRLTLRQDNLEALQISGGLRLDALGKTIADTVKLCQNLGDQFLWVDSLCIIQDLDDVKLTQIAAMDTVYSLASWTICATAGNDVEAGLPGVFSREREFYIDNRHQNTDRQVEPDYGHYPLETSDWSTRGWTFQERELSRRCMHFCARRIYWKCATSFLEEENGQFCEKPLKKEDTSLVNRQNLAQHQVGQGYWDCWPETYKKKTDGGYRWLVQEYTARELRYESDIQAAFAGVAALWQTLLTTRLVYEIPERFLEIGLSWNNQKLRPRSCLDLPSWSWTSQVGPIDYPIRITGRLAQFYILEADRTLTRLESNIPHTDDIGWPVGRSHWTAYSKTWLNQTKWNSPPILSSSIFPILKTGTLTFVTQTIKLRLAFHEPLTRGPLRQYHEYIELRTPKDEFAGLIEGSLRNPTMFEDLSAYLSCELCTFVGFAASEPRSSTMTQMPAGACGKGDAMVVAWLVRFDGDGVAYRVTLARVLLWIWEESEPETSTIYLR